MSKNMFEKLADKLLQRKDKGDALKKYNIDLSGVLGDDINYDELKYNEHRRLIGTAKVCLNNQLHFWIAKNGNFKSRIDDLERDIRIAATISDHINKKTHTQNDIDRLKAILSKHGCV